MKKFNELTPEDCQSFLDELFEDDQITFKRVIDEPTMDETPGIEYTTHEQSDTISISNPELLTWMYQNNVDLTQPLENLKYEYTEMDETNSILFEYAMEINKIIKEYSNILDMNNTALLQEMGPTYAKDLDAIMRLQKELINKL
jgi:hypothetical protein